MNQSPYDKADEAMRRGREAARVMEEPMLKEAFEKVAADITGAWATSAPHETARREQLYLQLQTVQGVREHLRAVMAGGQMAEAYAQRKLGLPRPF